MSPTPDDVMTVALAIICIALLLRLWDKHKTSRARASIQLSISRLMSTNG